MEWICILPLLITTSQVEQWNYVKFFCKVEKLTAETPLNFTAVCGNNALTICAAYGNTSDLKMAKITRRWGVLQQQANSIKEWWKCAQNFYNHVIRLLSDDWTDSRWFGISYGSGQSILKKRFVSVTCICKFVPHILMEYPIKVFAAQLLEWSMQEARFLLKMIAGDESCVFVCSPETKYQF